METRVLECPACGSTHVVERVQVTATQRVSRVTVAESTVAIDYDGYGYEVNWDTAISMGLACGNCGMSSSGVAQFARQS